MAYKQNAGGPRQSKTGGGLPGQLHNDGPKQIWDTIKKVGRTAVQATKDVGTQMLDLAQPDANKYGGVGSRKSQFKAKATKERENASFAKSRAKAKKGDIYFSLADSFDDDGYGGKSKAQK
jgi:hypothetical protein